MCHKYFRNIHQSNTYVFTIISASNEPITNSLASSLAELAYLSMLFIPSLVFRSVQEYNKTKQGNFGDNGATFSSQWGYFAHPEARATPSCTSPTIFITITFTFHPQPNQFTIIQCDTPKVLSFVDSVKTNYIHDFSSSNESDIVALTKM